MVLHSHTYFYIYTQVLIHIFLNPIILQSALMFVTKDLKVENGNAINQIMYSKCHQQSIEFSSVMGKNVKNSGMNTLSISGLLSSTT